MQTKQAIFFTYFYNYSVHSYARSLIANYIPDPIIVPPPAEVGMCYFNVLLVKSETTSILLLPGLVGELEKGMIATLVLSLTIKDI